MSSHIQNNIYAKHYAGILYGLAKDNSVVEALKTQLIELSKACKNDVGFVRFCNNPTISNKVKIVAIAQIAKQCEFNKLIANLLLALAKNGRLSLIAAIIDNFVELESKDKGELIVEVTSASKLSAQQQQNIQRNLEKSFNASVILQLTQDASLIAGVKIKYGSHELDASAQGVLRNAESRLYAAIEKTEMV
jgi:F-type H+-transporting ATPase subunit delta